MPIRSSSKRLTQQVVENLVAKPHEYVEWCGRLPGFGCRVRQSGSKTFIVMYRTGGRGTPLRKIVIGSTEKLTVDKARSEAERVLAQATLGVDEVAEQRRREEEERARLAEEARRAFTVEMLCHEYLERGLGTKKPLTIETDKSRIRAHIIPRLGAMRACDVTRQTIEDFMHAVAGQKETLVQKTGKKKGKSIVTGGRGAAGRCVALLGAIFSYAVRQGYVEKNPKTGVKTFPDRMTERFLSTAELQRLGATLRLAETEGLPYKFRPDRKAKHRPVLPENQTEKISLHAVAAIRLLLATGCRLREILNLRWDEVDLERAHFKLADSKTGARYVLLPGPAVALLSDLPRLGEFVIAGPDPKRPRADLKRPWEQVRRHARLGHIRIHDLRHTYASLGAASGFGLTQIGRLLGHRDPTTTARYAHLADTTLRRTADEISGQIWMSLDAEPDLPESAGANAATDPSSMEGEHL